MVAVRARGLGRGGGLFRGDTGGRTKSEPCDWRQSLLFLLCGTWTRASAVGSLNGAICCTRTMQRHCCCCARVRSAAPNVHWLFLKPTGPANYHRPLLRFARVWRDHCFPAHVTHTHITHTLALIGKAVLFV